MTLLDRLRSVKAFAFDIDGVLTDGTIWVFDEGTYIRRMNIKDGFALQLAVKKGYPVFILSGSTGDAVKTRLRKLGITHVYMQVEDKQAKLEELMKEAGLKWEEVLYMGDDIPDLPAIKMAGVSCAPADAATEIRDAAHYISPWGGGAGCVRDVMEKVLRLHQHWDPEAGVVSR